MAEDQTSFKTHQNIFAGNLLSRRTRTTSTVTARQSSRLARLGHVFMGAWTLAAAMATATNLGWVQMLEYQAQKVFFELRGPVAPPDNIVILAIDEPSLSQAQIYRTNPEQYAELEPLKAFPWKRTAYAIAIEKLMAAGARSVAVDVVFDARSSYGTADDEQLRQALQRYAGRVTLAALYEEAKVRQGSLMQLILPDRLFLTPPMSVGSVNFPKEGDGRVYRLANEFPKLLAKNYQREFGEFEAVKVAVPSFDEAALQAAQIKYSRPKGDRIYFYGPQGTFEQIPFWHVLDPDNWNTYLQQGKYFNNKIVIIGATAALLQDFHPTPFSESWLHPNPMSGVEIHANAIATLMQDRAIAQAIPDPPLRSLFVLLGVGGTAILLGRPKRQLTRLLWVVGSIIVWGGSGYASFVYGLIIIPTAIPIVAIALGGLSYLVTGAVSNHFKKINLRRILERHPSSPVVQEIISQQDDLQDLLQRRQQAIFGKVIGGHYKIVNLLGAGGFSETYIAEDTQRPGKPLCVVKQLRPANTNPKHLQLARRLFQLEAQTLEKLGTHDQIPRLLAYFDEDEEFYLVQELIVGHPLNQELLPGQSTLEAPVIHILQDLLQTLEFVHKNDVIHRDIKPSNIIRRHSDGKLVLIDFGAVKEVTTQMLEHEGQTRFTIPIGTQGYAPHEQCVGRPRFSSDIYAVGMTAIKALTGLAPHELDLDSETGEFLWTHKAQVSPELAAILSKMVRYDFTQRYQSASEARLAIEPLVNTDVGSLAPAKSSTTTMSTQDLDTSTVPWLGVAEDTQ